MLSKPYVAHAARVLFLGTNDQSTDDYVTRLALESGSKNHGLVQDASFVPEQPGCYHTTTLDIPWGGLINLSSKFDQIIMLDQPRDQWSHWKCLQATCKLMLKLEEMGMSTQFRDNQNVKSILYWMDMVYQQNKSFCIYPWINFHNDGSRVKLCTRDCGTLTTVKQLQDWQTDKSFTKVRNAMLEGQKIPEHCSVCYDYESKGVESYRQFETLDWVLQLDLQDINDLSTITRPFFYEIQTGNHCNIKCRGCEPSFSQPIAQEVIKFGIKLPVGFGVRPQQGSIDLVDIDNLDHRSSVYFQGGEPTIMPEVRDFMKRCIKKNRTDFFFTMCTNGVRLPTEFLDLIKNFSNVNFSFSLDGYGQVNDYWRWGSKWNTVIGNAHRVAELGHNLSINTVPGIYNATNLHLLLEFLDREFPFTSIYMQINYHPSQSVLNHPLKDMVIDSMRRCQQTSVYHSNGKSCKTAIDSIHDHYANDPHCDLDQLRAFFAYNDQLDKARGSRLADYIPELEATRSFLQ